MRRLGIAFLVLLSAGVGCERRSASRGSSEHGSTLNVFQLRNLGKLHADRDTPEGLEEAVAVLEEVVRRSPDDFLDRLNLARVCVFEEGRVGDAGIHVGKAESLLPGEAARPALDYVTGLYLKRTGAYAEAARRFQAVTAARPDVLQAWQQRARAEEQSGDFGGAEESYRQALAVAPRYRPAAYRRAMVLRQLNRTKAARDALEFAIALPEEDQPDSEKCGFTRVERRPYGRAEIEPPRVPLTYDDVTPSYFGTAARTETANVHEVLPFDANNDGQCDLLLLGPAETRVALREGARLNPRAIDSFSTGAASGARGGAAADLDNDGATDIVLMQASGLRWWQGRGDGTFEPTAPIRRANDTDAVSLFDQDHDGDLDIIALAGGNAPPTPGRAIVFQNNGDYTFTELQPFAEYVYEGSMVSGDGHDLDQENDIDFVFPATGRHPAIAFLNRRDGSFQSVPLPTLESRNILVEDLTNDGAPDIFGWDPGWTLRINADRYGSARNLRLEPAPATPHPLPRVHHAVLRDLDHDADLDVLAAVETGVAALRNTAGGVLVAEELFSLSSPVHRVAAADLDGDCGLEAIAVTADGNLRIFATELRGRSSRIVRPQGARDNRHAIGTVVEQFSGQLYQSVMIKGPNGVHLGLGHDEATAFDGLRLRWPQGIIQPLPRAELPDASCELKFRQREGLVASCPFLYARGAKEWQFLTDVVGLAPLDEWLPPGKIPHHDPEEYVRIEGSAVAAHDGRWQFAITEELRETTYLDRVELLVVDHPAEVDLYLNESTQQGTYDDLTVYVVRRDDLAPPPTVLAKGVADARSLVARRDGRYLHAYGPSPSQWAGWVDRYFVDLLPPFPSRLLLLTGRIAWYDSTVVYALSQHRRTWGPLRLEALNGGAPRILASDLGLPAGLDRTMVIDLEAPSSSADKLRLSGQHRFLWDALFFARDADRVVLRPPEREAPSKFGPLRFEPVTVRRANLSFHGYSQARGNRARHEQTYDYSTAGVDDWFGRARGHATRYGEVTTLLDAHDDLLVVLVAGDKVTFEFDAKAPPPAHQRRTFFLRTSGWAKEGSYHNRTGGTIEPLPYRGMRRYPPPPEERRTDAIYLKYHGSYQTREIRW